MAWGPEKGSEDAVRESEQEQQDDYVPGTVHIVDLEGILRVKHARDGEGGQRDIILHPPPSTDPDDPLNWSKPRKLLAMASMSVYTLMVGIASAAIYSVLGPISDATNLSLADLNAGTGYMFLFFGWGCLVWQPLALQYGKRPVYLVSILATGAICAWAPYTRSNGQWIANKILQGFFGAPIESLCEASVADVWFTHERGWWMAVYGLMLAGSNFFAPIIAGFITDGQGWQWVLYWCAIFCASGFVFLVLFMEETNYSRDMFVGVDATAATQQQSNVPASDLSSADISFELTKPKEERDDEKNENAMSSISTSVPPDKAVTSPRTKSYLQRLRLFSPGVFSKPNKLVQFAVRPLTFLSFPVVFYAGFCYGSSLVWFNVLNGTTSLILGGPPYNFRASLVGLSYVSPLIGVGLSAAYTGWFGDWFMIHLARKNGGILEPEYRLWLFAAFPLLLPFSMILWGVGAAHHVHWFGLIFAMCLIACVNTVGLQISVSYAIDSYRELAGEVITTVILIRNTMSFALNYGLTPWIKNLGYQNAFLVAAFAGMAQILTFLIVVKFGKSWRRSSRCRYERYVREMADVGLAH